MKQEQGVIKTEHSEVRKAPLKISSVGNYLMTVDKNLVSGLKNKSEKNFKITQQTHTPTQEN